MNQSVMTWIVIFLLILIIVLLGICIYLDVQTSGLPLFTTGNAVTSGEEGPPDTSGLAEDSSSAKTTEATDATATTEEPPVSTTPDTTTEEPPVSTTPDTTTEEPPVSTTPDTTTEEPTVTTVPETTAEPKPPIISPDAPTICIDPGHGFTDPGAVAQYGGKEVFEKDINMAISLKLKEALNALGYNVIFTHDGVNLPDSKYTNTSLTPYNVNGRRSWILDHKSEIDLVISIHSNTNPSTAESGTICYILPSGNAGYTSKSITLANRLNTAFATASEISTRNTRVEYLRVLDTGIPSVLVESAFMTNQGDLQKLLNESWQLILAQKIAQGVDAYLKG